MIPPTVKDMAPKRMHFIQWVLSRETWKDRETDTQRDRETDEERHTQTDTERQIERDTQTDREIDTQTDGEGGRYIEIKRERGDRESER